jgi:hypothetical protein
MKHSRDLRGRHYDYRNAPLRCTVCHNVTFCVQPWVNHNVNACAVTLLTSFLLKSTVFWGVAPCRSCVNRRFGGTYGLIFRLQAPAHAGSSLADFSTLKTEAKRSSETSVHTRSTRRHTPECGILHYRSRENLKSYIVFFYFGNETSFKKLSV